MNGKYCFEIWSQYPFRRILNCNRNLRIEKTTCDSYLKKCKPQPWFTRIGKCSNFDVVFVIQFNRIATVMLHACMINAFRWSMMTSSTGNILRVSGPLCGEFTGHRWIPLKNASDTELWCLRWSAPEKNGWVFELVGDLRRHRTHYYDVIIMRRVVSIA